MPYIHFSEQEKELAKQADIVWFLQAHGEQVKRSGKEFAWDSPAGKVTIRENQWYSQYEQTGGGAVKFLRKFFGMTYPEAVRSLLGESAGQEIRAAVKEKTKPEPKNFSPPPPHSDMRRLYAYLLNERGIDRDIIHAFTHEGLMYEDAVNHNVCFVGKDDAGTVRHLHKRATNPLSDFKGNITGSDADYAFHYSGRSDRLYVFEAPIDLLAFLTLYPAGWQEHSYVALCSTADRAALRMLKDHPQLKQVYLCLDHDSAGIEGAYNGITFPEYLCGGPEESSVAICHGGRTEFVYPPCEQSSIEFALERLGADSLDDCHIQMSCSRFGKPLSEVMDRILNDESLEAFNEVCHAAAKIPDRDLDKFTAAVLYANADTSCEVCRIAESIELFEYAPGVRDTNNLGAWWLENKLDCSLPFEIDEFFDYAGYGESIAENNDGEFVEGLGFVCMEEGYTLEDVLQDTDQGMGGM